MTTVADPCIQKAQEQIAVNNGLVQKIHNRVNQLLPLIPEPFAHSIKEIQNGMKEFDRANARLNELMQEPLAQMGSPSRLREVADQLHNHLVKPLSAIAGELYPEWHPTNGSRDSSLRWDGDAADAYRGLFPGQRDAVNGIQNVAATMSGKLRTVANAIETFWITVAAAFVTFYCSLRAAYLALVAAVTAPTIVTVLGSAAVAAAAFASAAVNAAHSEIQAINTQTIEIKNTVQTFGKEWHKPKYMPDLGDGSVSDGNKSKWELPL